MADDLRIALIGQAAFGESVLNALVESGENIVGVFSPPDREGRPLDPIKLAAQQHGVSVFQFRRMRNQEAVESFIQLKADLCLMVYVTDIVPDVMLEAPTRGTIQYHPSLLPKHRGPSSINWPIIQGESETGLTIFWPDRGLDTGPILLQKKVEIGPDDTLGSLYFDKLFPLGVQGLIEAVEMVRHGIAPQIAQDDSQATYEGWCRAENVIINWEKPANEIYNLIRGSDPSPGAGSTLDGKSVQFYRTLRHDGDSGKKPGTVTEVSDKGFVVAAKGGTLLIQRVQPEGSRKVMATEWMESVGLRPGTMFGS